MLKSHTDGKKKAGFDLDVRELRINMGEYFNEGDLKTIAFDLGVDWDNMAGDIKTSKIMSMIGYMQSRERLDDLIDICEKERPDVEWKPFKNINSLEQENFRFRDSSSVDEVIRTLDPENMLSVRLVIEEIAQGFEMTLSGPFTMKAVIPLTRYELNKLSSLALETLRNVVYLQASGMSIYQQRIDMPLAVHKHVLPILADAGRNLFEAIFYSYGSDPEAHLLGDTFIQLAQAYQLNLEIFSAQFRVPWQMLYVGSDIDNPDPEMFVGFKHIVSHVAVSPKLQHLRPKIDTTKGLLVSLNVNSDIDAQMGTPIIGRQIDYWDNLTKTAPNLTYSMNEHAQDVLKDLSDSDSLSQVKYVYAHSEVISWEEMDRGGPDASGFVFTGHQELKLATLRRNRQRFQNSPLVFLNCEETARFPFADYLMSKGCRGVIGTETENPALFAEELANRFFRQFLSGLKVGEILLNLRRDFLFNHNNVLGLLYSLFGSSNVQLDAPILEQKIEYQQPRNISQKLMKPLPSISEQVIPENARVVNVEVARGFKRFDLREGCITNETIRISMFVDDQVSKYNNLSELVLLDEFFTNDRDTVEFEVKLDGGAFRGDEEFQALQVPIEGSSKRVGFKVDTPDKLGVYYVTAILMKNGELLRTIPIRFNVYDD